MSNNNLGYKQSANVERRTWDTEVYEERAKARNKNGDFDASSSSTATAGSQADPDAEKEEFRRADAKRAGPMYSKRAYLKSRSDKVDLEGKLHKREVISAEAAAVSKTDGVTKSSTGVGWHCRVCDCFLKDSLTYLDHINGRKHQRALGYSMRVEKSSLSEVEERLEMHKRKREEGKLKAKKVIGKDDINNDDIFTEKIREKDEEITRRKAERAKKKKARKQAAKADAANEEGFEGLVDSDMAKMMGFSGFGAG
mmetsp:Transcript_17541/g.27322  ORF Transcript_17541/g.27322 Transcript_17541/m.27322 type:complete len:254 (-) Transcript_17541:58-819(-)